MVMARGAAEIAELEWRRRLHPEGRPVSDGCGALGRAAALVLAAFLAKGKHSFPWKYRK